MNIDTCGCCQGVEVVTPASEANRPGLSALPYRAGTHATFFESMLALLSIAPAGESNPLQRLTARDTGDFSIALLDAFATTADVLTFYQERIVNEGFLGTATERRSILELARLIGYRLRPGLSASGFLAFFMQKDATGLIPVGTAAKSVPAPGQLLQTFETGAVIQARSEWNELVPRRTRPQNILLANAMSLPAVWLTGSGTRLKPNDLLLFDFGSQQRLRRVSAIEEDHDNKRTKVLLQEETFTAAAFIRRVVEAIGSLPAVPAGLPEKEAVEKVFDSLQTLPSTLSIADLDDTVETSLQALNGLQLMKVSDVLAKTEAHRQDLVAKRKGHTKDVSDSLAPLQQRYQSSADKISDAFADVLEALKENTPTAGFGSLIASLDASLSAISASEIANLQLTLWNGLRTAVAQINTDSATSLTARIKAAADKFKTLKDANKKGAKAALDLANGVSQGFTTSLRDGLKAWDDAQDGLDDARDASNEEADHPVANEIDSARKAFADFYKRLQQAVSDASFVPLAKAGASVKKLDLKTPAGLGLAAMTARIKEVLAFAAGYSSGLLDALKLAYAGEQTSILNDINASVAAFQASLPASGGDDTSLGIVLKTIHDAERPLTPGPTDLADFAVALDQAITALDPTQTGAGLPSLEDLKKLTDAVNGAAAQLQSITLGTPEAPGFRAVLASNVADVFTTYGDKLQATDTEVMGLLAELKSNWGLGVQPDPHPETRAIAASVQLLKVDLETLAKRRKANVDAMATAKDKARIGDWFDGIAGELDTMRSVVEEKVVSPVQQTVDLTTLTSALGGIAAGRGATGAVSASSLTAAFGDNASDAVLRTLIALKPELGVTLYAGLGNLRSSAPPVGIYALRVKAQLFGATAPQRTEVTTPPAQVHFIGDWPVLDTDGNKAVIAHEEPDAIYLDNAYEQITPGGWVVLDSPKVTGLLDAAGAAGGGGGKQFTLSEGGRVVYKAGAVTTAGRAEYGISGKSTRIELRAPSGKPGKWINTAQADLDAINHQVSPALQKSSSLVIRKSVVYAQSEALALAEAPIDTPVGKCASGITPNEIELEGEYDGLDAGRWIVVSGQSTSAPVPVREVAQLAGVRHIFSPSLPGDTAHTVLTLTRDLTACYVRSSVVINGNVAPATHGETQKQVLGSGDGGAASQRFALSRSPLTYLSAPTASGINSTLEVRVNDVLWQETDTTCGHGPTERIYTTEQNDASVTTIQFGDGREGARLPSGVENVRAVYRAGIGAAGNVDAGQITILSAPPLGVTAVNNPLPVTGGADTETRDQARRNAPLAVLSLDRLVSLRDYADFARTYAGIAKARAGRVKSKSGSVIEVTVAVVDDIPIAEGSDLFVNLGKSLRGFGDPQQPVRVRVRDRLMLILSADVALAPGYSWEFVEPAIRAALLNAFSFDNRELGQSALPSEVLAAIHQTAGVAYADVNVLGAISANLDAAGITDAIATLGSAKSVPVGPNQIAYLSSSVKESLVLNPIEGEERV
jgi:hypothetical protein